MLEAERTGQFLNAYFDENNYTFDEVIIECSPFLGCMMTAAKIASCLWKTEVTINYLAA